MNKMSFAVVGVGLFLIATGAGAAGQLTPSASSNWEMGGFVKGARVFPMGKARLRSAPSPTAPVLREVVASADAPGAASDITITERLDQTFRDATGYRDSWYKISFTDTGGGAKRAGFVWGGDLAKAALSADLDGDGAPEFILVGVGGKPGAKPSGENKRVVTTRVLKPNGGGASLAFAPIETQESDAFGYSLSAQALAGGKGLSGKPGIIRIKFRYEACDYPNGDVYLVYAKKRLSYGLTAFSVANEFGGVASDVYFPSDKNGKPGRVFVRSVTQQNNQATGKTIRQSAETVAYTWNGVTLRPVRR